MAAPHSSIRLRSYREDDLGLLHQLLGNPEMTRFLGGPESDRSLAGRHERYLESDPETTGLFVVVVGDDEVSAGWVGFWESEWEGETTWEVGWHVLPQFQGQGVATAGARLALASARSRRRHRFVDVFPAVDNDASNAVCRRLSFRRLGEVEVEYPKGRMMRAMHWRLDLGDGSF